MKEVWAVSLQWIEMEMVCLRLVWGCTLTLCAVALPLNCGGMYRGVIRPDGVPLTAIFFDEPLSEL